MAVKAPALIEPWGQASNAGFFRFKFPPTSDAPATWRLQIAEDPEFGTLHHQHSDTGYWSTAHRVDYPYPAGSPALAVGRIYWWRARADAPVVGPWSRTHSFSPDPRGASGPYDLWARALLNTTGYPRTTTLVGSLIPVSAQVAQLLTLPFGSRVTLRSDNPPDDRIAEVVGWSLHLDALAGWEVSIVSRDVEAGF